MGRVKSNLNSEPLAPNIQTQIRGLSHFPLLNSPAVPADVQSSATCRSPWGWRDCISPGRGAKDTRITTREARTSLGGRKDLAQCREGHVGARGAAPTNSCRAGPPAPGAVEHISWPGSRGPCQGGGASAVSARTPPLPHNLPRGVGRGDSSPPLPPRAWRAALARRVRGVACRLGTPHAGRGVCSLGTPRAGCGVCPLGTPRT